MRISKETERIKASQQSEVLDMALLQDPALSPPRLMSVETVALLRLVLVVHFELEVSHSTMSWRKLACG